MKRLIKKALKPFLDRKIWLRQITVAAIASATAWLVGDSVPVSYTHLTLPTN